MFSLINKVCAVLVSRIDTSLTTSGASTTLGSLTDGKIYAKETTTEKTTQIKSQLNFENLFESYSKNNTNIISSDIIAKNKDSKIETGEDGKLIILDLDNTYKTKTIKGKKNADFNFNISGGSAPDNQNYTKDGVNIPDYYYDEKTQQPTPIDNYTKDISRTLSEALTGIEEKFGFDFIKDKWNDSLRKAIKQQISEKNIEKNIIKGLDSGIKSLTDFLDKNLNEQFNQTNMNGNNNTNNKSKVEEVCDNKCKIKTWELNLNQEVKSIIKFGE